MSSLKPDALKLSCGRDEKLTGGTNSHWGLNSVYEYIFQLYHIWLIDTWRIRVHACTRTHRYFSTLVSHNGQGSLHSCEEIQHHGQGNEWGSAVQDRHHGQLPNGVAWSRQDQHHRESSSTQWISTADSSWMASTHGGCRGSLRGLGELCPLPHHHFALHTIRNIKNERDFF